MTNLADLHQRLTDTSDPAALDQVRREVRALGLVHLANALDRIAAKQPTQ